MKKLVIGLAAVLMLSGCAPAGVPTTPTTEPPQTVTETTAPTLPTEPAQPSFYVEGSTMERATGGVIRMYQMDTSVTGLAMMGENLLACTDNRTLHLLAGETLEEIRSRELSREIAWGGTDLVITEKGLAYYDEPNSAYVTLDSNLVSGPSYVISGRNLSRPLISSDFSAIYFATEDGIEVMNLQDGTSRLLRQEHEDVIRLGGLLFDNSVLYYNRRESSGLEQTCFVDTASGSLSRTNRFQGQMMSRSNHFSSVMKVEHALGQESWVITGNKYGRIQMLRGFQQWDSPILLENGYVVLQQRSRVGVQLSCIDLLTGKQLAQVMMPQQNNLFAYGCVDGEKIWLCDGSSSRFFCWDLERSVPGIPLAELTAFASLGNPDPTAMDSLMAEVRELEEQLSVRITFESGGNRTGGTAYEELPDYRPAQYRQAVERLREAAENLPELLLLQVSRRIDSGLEIVLVDQFDPVCRDPGHSGSFSVEAGTGRICVDMCQNLPLIFYHELFHVMEVQIRNAGDGLKYWADLNPEGFAYTGSADPEQKLPPEDPRLVFGTNVVADEQGLVSGREDRAQLFLYACMDGQQARFASPTMQQKLRLLSAVIRDNFWFGEDPVWEQYILPDPEPQPTEQPEETAEADPEPSGD